MKVTTKHLADSIHEGAKLFLHEGLDTRPSAEEFDEDGNHIGSYNFKQASVSVDGVRHYGAPDGKLAQYDPFTGLATVASGVQVTKPILSVTDVENAIKTGLTNAGIEIGSLTQAELRLITAEATHIVTQGTPSPLSASKIQGVVERLVKAAEEKKVDPQVIERELKKIEDEREAERKREQQRLESLAAYANSPAIQEPIEAHARGALARAAVAVEVLITTAQRVYEEYAIRRAERQKTLENEILKLTKENKVALKDKAQELFGTKRGQGPIYELARSRGITFDGNMSNITVVERQGQQFVRFAPNFEVAGSEVTTFHAQSLARSGQITASTLSVTYIRTVVLAYNDAQTVSAAQGRNLSELKQQKTELEKEVLVDAKKHGFKANEVDDLEHVRQFQARINVIRDYDRKIEQAEAQQKEVRQDVQLVEARITVFSEFMSVVMERRTRLGVQESENVREHKKEDFQTMVGGKPQPRKADHWQKEVSSKPDQGNGRGTHS